MFEKVRQQVSMRPFLPRRRIGPETSIRPIGEIRTRSGEVQQYWYKAVRGIEWIEAAALPQGGDELRLAGPHAEADYGTSDAKIEQSFVPVRRFDRVLISAQLGNTDRRYPAQPRTVERQYKPLDPPGCADQLVILTTPAAMYELAGNC